jgi:hypothetical protein
MLMKMRPWVPQRCGSRDRSRLLKRVRVFGPPAVALAAAGVVAGCAGSGPLVATPSGSGGSLGITQTPRASSPLPLYTPSPPLTSPPAGIPYCAAGALEVSYEGIMGAAGTEYGRFEARNASMSSCYLQGFVDVTMLDSHQQALPTHTAHAATPATSLAGVVIMPPGTAALASSNKQGHAYFSLVWSGSTCAPSASNTPSWWRVTMPRIPGDLVLSAAPGGIPSGTVCNGDIGIQPINDRG